jgi:cold-inducible RNA-binding protein
MKLYVGNLSFQTTEGALEELFAGIGTVTDTHLVLDRATQRSRGFGFVTMSTAEEGQRAIDELHGKAFDGRTISVSEARPREDRPPRRDFGGGGGRQGGDRGERGDRGDRGDRRGGGGHQRRY